MNAVVGTQFDKNKRMAGPLHVEDGPSRVDEHLVTEDEVAKACEEQDLAGSLREACENLRDGQKTTRKVCDTFGHSVSRD